MVPGAGSYIAINLCLQSVDNTLGLCASTMEEICRYSRQLLVRLRAKCVARIEEFPLYMCVFVG